nr:MAG TPA: hypothetical protein [Caudoviricetes sp.]
MQQWMWVLKRLFDDLREFPLMRDIFVGAA